MMEFQIEYEVTQASMDAALAIMEKTVFRRKKIASVISFGLFALFDILLSILDRNLWTMLLALVFVVLCISTLGSFRKEFIDANSMEKGQRYWSARRKLTVYDTYVQIYAGYENPDEELTDEERADADYMQMREEMNEEMSRTDYAYAKCRCYESDQALMLYCSRDKNQTLLKSQLTDAELGTLRSLLQERLGKRYIILGSL